MARFLNSEGNLLMDLNFSLSETYTGKLWIDGKKIYEKLLILEHCQITAIVELKMLLMVSVN